MSSLSFADTCVQANDSIREPVRHTELKSVGQRREQITAPEGIQPEATDRRIKFIDALLVALTIKSPRIHVELQTQPARQTALFRKESDPSVS